MCCSKHFTGVVMLVCASGVARAQLNVGQIDTFEDGTTMGWTAGYASTQLPLPPTNISTGGPTGVDDNYLQITATGGMGPGSRLSAFNLAQWAGDYIDAGITSIGMDVRNFGPDDAYLRLRFADPMAGPPTNVAITDSVFLPAGGDWTSISFAIDASSLIAILGERQTALSDATELRIFHNPEADFPGPPVGPPPVNLMLGVDNIVAPPEPSAALVLGTVLLWGSRRRRD